MPRPCRGAQSQSGHPENLRHRKGPSPMTHSFSAAASASFSIPRRMLRVTSYVLRIASSGLHVSRFTFPASRRPHVTHVTHITFITLVTFLITLASAFSAPRVPDWSHSIV